VTESSSTHQPGWYHAQGDPPGTQRYWDGAQWVGGPQAAAGAAPVGGYGAQVQTGGRTPAGYGPRIVAAIIDGLYNAAIALVGVILLVLALAVEGALGGILVLLALLAFLASFAFGIWNVVIRQGQTGQTMGKEKQGLKLVADATGQPIGAGQAVIRWLLGGVINSFCFIDAIFVLIDEENRRLTDKLLNLNVVQA
jgi:uncharacterized RDD family membrane protein YckC